MGGSINPNGTLSGKVSIKQNKSSITPRQNVSGKMSNQLVNPDYEDLKNLPTINGVLVKGDLTSDDLLIERGYDAKMNPMNNEHLILST